MHKGGCCLTCSSDANSVGVLQCTRVGVVSCLMFSSDENSVGCWCVTVHKGGCCFMFNVQQ